MTLAAAALIVAGSLLTISGMAIQVRERRDVAPWRAGFGRWTSRRSMAVGIPGAFAVVVGVALLR
ncbi:MAG TPA: hypothetical protein VHC43_12985 [Mycobacteriales bacterium]|nr:hypothetical protein [Mycobacteriales bacterium]